MKKALILPVFVLLASCADVEGPIYKGHSNQGCDYYNDSGDCISRKEVKKEHANKAPKKIIKPRRPVEYTYADYEGQAVQNTPIIDCIPATQVIQQAPAPILVPQVAPQVINATPCNGCQPTVQEVREPVEITYKKTTYTTVYQPKTYEAVSFEKQAITGNATVVQDKVQLVGQPTQIVTTTPTTVVTMPTIPVNSVTTEVIVPANEIK